MKNRFKLSDVAPMSAIALGAGVLGVVLAWVSQGVQALFIPWVAVSMVSIILPVLAKKLRLGTFKMGRTAEIAAIFLGGLNYYLVIFGTGLPILLGYVGWIICGLLYATMK